MKQAPPRSIERSSLPTPGRTYYRTYYMGTRTVRLDEEAERLLSEIRRQTGTTVSGALKRGLEVAARELRERAATRPYDIFRQIELGEGGYARAPARKAKKAIAGLLRKRRG